ncbi:Conserved hypothetical protein [Candidatus Glomeribacter gigasporarum BEG34]|uniref:DUF559 domain-containing protein n=1 Tax=Candidatus Glomeribacter gigasporarum BEG34 TaxID=1070319 RepID=G2JC03_9BURK|nr:DUF559 domain-containing protein [Candidatus Glomeribacter gigasporarum]CCD30309.1 Conserved hypothetical protein [Candidatus Glomeribacter gigasporarum BEG34]
MDADPQAAVDERAESTVCIAGARRKTAGTAAEYRFDAMRRWKFDFAWPNWKIVVECEGGIWAQGRHTRALGFEADCDKYNAATVQGWRVLRFTRDMIQNGAAMNLLTRAIQQAA